MLTALVPDYIGPVDGATSYPEDDCELDLAQVGFFVPRYMNQGPNYDWAERMPRLEVLQLLTAGYEQALAYVRAGVTLCNAAGVHDASTAELAVGLILASQRAIDVAARDMKTGTWGHETQPSLADRRVVIIGAGHVGTAIADRLLPFECDVTIVGRTRRGEVRALGDLPELLPLAEIVVLAVPLDDSTRAIVDAAFLDRLPAGALVVNVARGPVVVTDDLVAALAAGRVRAALDVTDPEPLPPGHPLWSAPGALITPHVGGNTSAFVPRANRLVREQLAQWRAGEPVEHIVAGERR